MGERFVETRTKAAGTVKGDAIIAMVELAGKVIEYNGNSRIDDDYKTAQSQLSAVKSVVNDVQFAIDNKLISDNLTEFANYLLDGRSLTIVSTYTDKNGVTTATEYPNTSLLKKFEQVSSNIIKRKGEIKKCSLCASQIR